jgi:hypothetical protein
MTLDSPVVTGDGGGDDSSAPTDAAQDVPVTSSSGGSCAPTGSICKAGFVCCSTVCAAGFCL